MSGKKKKSSIRSSSSEARRKKNKNVLKKLKMFNRPVCVLTGKEILLQDSLKVPIYDRPICLLIGFKLLLQENKIHKKDSISGEIQCNPDIRELPGPDTIRVYLPSGFGLFCLGNTSSILGPETMSLISGSLISGLH